MINRPHKETLILNNEQITNSLNLCGTFECFLTVPRHIRTKCLNNKMQYNLVKKKRQQVHKYILYLIPKTRLSFYTLLKSSLKFIVTVLIFCERSSGS